MTIEEIIQRISRDEAQHMSGGPAGLPELQQLEQRLCVELPSAYRAFLGQLGAGIYYEKHEIFGCRRVMIHDIELVPDLASVERQLEREGVSPRQGMIPFHRGGGCVHLIDLNSGPRQGSVVRVQDECAYPHLPAFLEEVVLP
jgi:hypothetical protein